MGEDWWCVIIIVALVVTQASGQTEVPSESSRCFGHWGEWRACQLDEGGNCTRSRDQHLDFPVDDENRPCVPKTQTEPCAPEECGDPRVCKGSWSAWSTCSEECRQTQTFTLDNNDTSVDTSHCANQDSDTESRDCDGGACVKDTAPTSLSYPGPDVTILCVGMPIPGRRPTWEGGAPERFESDRLPPALAVNTTTGVLGGTPREESSEKSYTIEAVNSGGRASTTLTLEVKPPMQLGSTPVRRKKWSPVVDIELTSLSTTYYTPHEVVAVVAPSQTPLNDILCQAVPLLRSDASSIISPTECPEEGNDGGGLCLVGMLATPGEKQTLYLNLMEEESPPCWPLLHDSEELKVVGLVTLLPNEQARRDVPMIREYLDKHHAVGGDETPNVLMLGMSSPEERAFKFVLEDPSEEDKTAPFQTTIQLNTGSLSVDSLRELEQEVEKLLGVSPDRIRVKSAPNQAVTVVFMPEKVSRRRSLHTGHAEYAKTPFVLFEDFRRHVTDPRSRLYQQRDEFRWLDEVVASNKPLVPQKMVLCASGAVADSPQKCPPGPPPADRSTPAPPPTDDNPWYEHDWVWGMIGTVVSLVGLAISFQITHCKRTRRQAQRDAADGDGGDEEQGRSKRTDDTSDDDRQDGDSATPPGRAASSVPATRLPSQASRGVADDEDDADTTYAEEDPPTAAPALGMPYGHPHPQLSPYVGYFHPHAPPHFPPSMPYYPPHHHYACGRLSGVPMHTQSATRSSRSASASPAGSCHWPSTRFASSNVLSVAVGDSADEQQRERERRSERG